MSESVDLTPGFKAIRIEVVAADGLAKPDVFSLPDPFAVISVDAEQTHTTSVIERTLNPYWNEHFDVKVKGSSVVTVRIFDQRNYERRDQGFLGFVEIQVTDYLDLELGGQEMVRLDLKGTDDNPIVQGKLMFYLSTTGIPNTAVTSPRPNGSSFFTPLPSNGSSSSVHNTSVDNYSISNYSINNYSINNASVDGASLNNYSINNASLNDYSVDNASVDNYSVDNYSVNNYSVNNPSAYTASVFELFSPSIRLSRTLSSHTTASDVTTPIVAIPITIPGTHPEQRQSLPNIPSRFVRSDGASTAAHGHTQNPPRPSTPGIVSPGHAAVNAQHNPMLNANEDQYGPLPEGWETGIDPTRRTYYVNHHTGSITRSRPSPNQAVDHQAQESETSTIGLGSLPPGWEEQYTPEGRPYYVNLITRSTTLVDPRRQIMGPDDTPLPSRAILGLSPSLPGWVTGLRPTERMYSVGHRDDTETTTTRDDTRLPSSLDANAPQYKHDFHEKLIYFRTQPGMRVEPGKCQIKVRRNHIFEDSYTEIMRQTPNNLRKRLTFEFEGEDELDFGGPAREFFLLLSHEMFKPPYCLFKYSVHDSHMLEINPASVVNPDYNHCKFMGRVLGLSIFHRRFLDAEFNASFRKMILKKRVTLVDLESVDAELHRGLTWMLDNDITDLIDETFTNMEMRFGEMVPVDLKPGGASIAVTEENKKEYVDLMVEYYISKRIKDQFDAFMSGFHELIPQDLINVFDERELELLIGGTSEIDMDDWAKFTTYREYKFDDKVIQWFWKCVRSWPAVQRSKLLRFATGTTRISIYGFDDLRGPNGPQPFTIEKAGDPKQLPKSHTSFNRIDLPPYKNYASLEQNLTLAVERVSL